MNVALFVEGLAGPCSGQKEKDTFPYMRKRYSRFILTGWLVGWLARFCLYLKGLAFDWFEFAGLFEVLVTNWLDLDVFVRVWLALAPDKKKTRFQS